MKNTSEITRILDQQITTLGKLIACIRSQRHAIANNQLNELEATLHDQQPLISTTEQQFQQFLNILQKQGVNTESDRIAQFLDQLPDSQQAVGLWQQLQELTLQCMKENQLNGKIIEICNRQAKETLQLLVGQGPQVELYDPSGKTTKSAPLTLGKV